MLAERREPTQAIKMQCACSFSPTSGLSGPTKIPPPPYRETGVAIPLSDCVPVVSQTIAATPQLLSVKMAYRSPKTDLTRGISQKKLASEAYRAVGGVARNSIANRAKVGHQASGPDALDKVR